MTSHGDHTDELGDDLTGAIRDDLADRHDRKEVPAGDVDAVVASGRRRRRWQVAGGALAAVAVIGTGAAVVVGLPSDDGPPVIEQPSADTTPLPDTTPSTPAPTTTEGVTAAPTGSATGEPSTTSTSTSPTPASDDVGAASLVVATDEGIVRWEDGATTPVPGIDTAVDLAVDDGRGGIVFQRNEVGIGLLRDGEVSTLVALDQFEPQAFPDLVGHDEPLPPTALRLRDVDPATGRMVFTVSRGGMVDIGSDPRQPSFVDVVVTADLDGGDRRAVDSMFAFESGYADVALVGEDVLVHVVAEAMGGSYALVDEGGETSALPDLGHLGEGVAPRSDDPYAVDGSGVDGDRLAVVERAFDDLFGDDPGAGRLAVWDVRAERLLASRELTRPGPAGIPVDLAGDAVVLVESLDDGSSRSWLLDLDTGESTSVEGTASLARTSGG